MSVLVLLGKKKKILAKPEKSGVDYFIESMTNSVYDSAVLLCVVLVIALESV